jgi:hypothetical protein
MATESFFSNASLAYLASAGAGKDGKAYSIKPNDGSGDFTFSRGSNLAATRVGPTGLIEKGRENLLKQSNQFDTTWFFTNGVLTSGQSGYDGSNDAWKIERTNTTARIQQSVSINGVNTFSVYAKSGTLNWIEILNTSSPFQAAFFDLQNGVIGNVDSDTINAEINSVGNGWYRCEISLLFSGATSFRVSLADGNGDKSGTTGTIYIQDAQLEIGLAATEVITTGATTGKAGLLENEPRFDYSGGATCPSLLLEPSRTNLITYSEYFGDYNNNGITITPNATISPEGVQNAALLVEDSGSQLRLRTDDIAFTLNNPFVYSIFVKSSGNFSLTHEQLPKFSVGFDFTGTPSFSGSGDWFDDAEIIPYGNDWYRCVVYITPDANFTSGVDIRLNNDSGYFWGWQVEQSSYPTSYIPNHSGGSVTRGLDYCTITSGISIGSGSEFGVYYEIDVDEIPRASSIPFIQIQFATASGGVGIKGASDALANFIDLYSTTDFSESFSALDMGSGIIKFFINYSSGTGDFYLNGTKYAGVISGPTSGCEIDSVYLVGSAYKLKAKQILLFPEALSDADCITLTT